MNQPARSSEQCEQRPRFKTLCQAPAGIPHYLTMATLPWLDAALAAIGLNAGTRVTKVCDDLPVRSALVETGTGRYVVSRQTAEAVVLEQNGSDISLCLLGPGQSGRVAATLSPGNRPTIGKDQIFHPGAQVKKIRDLPPEVRYTIRAPNLAAWTVSLNTATHVWGESDRRNLQLAAALVGKPFVLRRFSAPEAKTRFSAAGIHPGMQLFLAHLTPSDVPHDAICVKGPEQQILLPRRLAGHVYLRLCDVCWSCGACMA